MYRMLALLALLTLPSLGACGRESQTAAKAQPPVAARASQSTSAPARESGAAADVNASAVSQAEATQESTAQGATDEPGSATLERLAALPPEQQLPGGRWKAGVNYDAVVPAQPTNEPPGKVQVMEIFWLGCPHCYALEPSVLAWLKTKPDYVDFVRVPVMWGPVHRAHAHLFYALEALGRNDLVEKAFEEIHAYATEAQGQRSDLVQQHSPLVGNTEEASLAAQLAFAKANGIDADAFRKAYDSAKVKADLEHAQEITNRYQVAGVPLVIIDGRYSTDVGKAGGPTELFELVDSLAAAEHRKPHGA